MHLLKPEPSAAAALPLPPRLRGLLDAIRDRELAERLARVWSAAREALDEVERLALAPEGLDEPGVDPVRLSLWERAVPMLRDTLVALHRLFARVHTDFAPPAHEDAFASDGAPIVRALPEQQAARVLRLCTGRLEAQALAVYEQLQRGEPEADATSALAWELRGLHRTVRAELRELVLQSAAAFGASGAFSASEDQQREALLGTGARGVRLLRALPGSDAD
jgi:hypothetical protein